MSVYKMKNQKVLSFNESFHKKNFHWKLKKAENDNVVAH